MRTLLQHLFRLANRHAGKLLLLGLVGVAWRNWQRWQQDKRLLAQRKVPPALPPLEKRPALPLGSEESFFYAWYINMSLLSLRKYQKKMEQMEKEKGQHQSKVAPSAIMK